MRLPRKWVLSLGLLAAAPGVTLAGPLDFLKSGNSPAGGATGAPQDSQEVAEAVANALRGARLVCKDVAIEVRGGVCVLEGQIADTQQKAAAARLVAAVPGVQSVDNRLTLMEAAGAPRTMRSAPAVQQAGFEGPRGGPIQRVNHTSAAPSNGQIAQDVANAVAGAGIQGYDIEVRYKSGVAALVGDVGSAQEAAVAEQAARGVPGVDQVLNRLTVGGQPIPESRTMNQPGMTPGYPARPAGYPQMQAAPAGYPQLPPGAIMTPPGAPAPAGGHQMYNRPNMPEHAWPSYAPYDNYAQVTYPSAYDASAWPYIGPFYPYPQVPMEWRAAQLEWDDGHWQLQFHSRTDKWWWFLDPHNWQ